MKVPSLKNEETDFLERLKAEIPSLLYYLEHRQLATSHKTRMWFTPEQIKTTALENLMQNNRNRLEKELASLILNVMETFELEEVNVCPLDALQTLNRTRVKTDLTQLRQILKKEWNLSNQNNSLIYKKMIIWQDGGLGMIDAKGRYYTVKKSFILQHFSEDMK